MNIRWCAFYDEDASLALANGLKSVSLLRLLRKRLKKRLLVVTANSCCMKPSLALHTVGVATGTPLVNGATQETTYAASGDTWTQTIVTDGWTNSTTDILLAGDVITIAGCNSVNRKTRQDTGDLQTFVVTADANSGASTGPATLTISPPIIISGPYQTVAASPANNAAITVKTGASGSSHKQT